MMNDSAARSSVRADDTVRAMEASLAGFAASGRVLDMTRGKPSPAQLELATDLLALPGRNDYRAADGTDCRNYGGLGGLAESRELFGEMLGVDPDLVIVGGNSSLAMMHDALVRATIWGLPGGDRPWRDEGKIRFLCPAPGYDRHFAMSERFGFELVPVDMTATGPDMAAVEDLAERDPAVKGIWCVPRYSNPTGVTYSDETVRRLATMPTAAGDFRIFWDNAYCEHHLYDEPDPLASIFDACVAAGNEDRVLMFASTSKITFAGSGLAAMAASRTNITDALDRLAIRTIGPDKINQLRHARMFPEIGALRRHMRRHAELLRPRFEAVHEVLGGELEGIAGVSWTRPRGGYFISLDTGPGRAREVVARAAKAGVRLTAAGAPFPYGIDPGDRHIRIAPSFPEMSEIRDAMEVLALCVRLVATECGPGTG
jgi:aspartate/methionine/tyrosine aminotransferase